MTTLLNLNGSFAGLLKVKKKPRTFVRGLIMYKVELIQPELVQPLWLNQKFLLFFHLW